ncbi:3'-5' exonuclease [Streptomyces sp. GC420]|uniref:3'-5' exonuclease n=1 Tax=Streptomyces sp. GC420 TaxID=2697568 RepID=UPI001414F502|nr:3'-5' exonuclease [Streptomyces sp. GC420]NBM16915.1 DNA polymerase III [Streptomyces sp. GC420]
MDSIAGRDLRCVIDVEATCWEDEPPPGSVGEITAIGLTVVDLGALERVSPHRIPVRPARSAVSAFCTALTGLTQAEVDTGVGFGEACRILAAEHGAGARPWTSWGDCDRHRFTRQCRATGTPYPLGRRRTNAKAAFTQARGLRRRPGTAGALRMAGLPLEGRHHRGGDDAWNIAALVLSLARGDAWPGPTAIP